MTRRLDLLRPEDISVALLVALAGLSPAQREVWVDVYVLGLPQRGFRSSTMVAKANARLREHFGSSDGLRVAA